MLKDHPVRHNRLRLGSILRRYYFGGKSRPLVVSPNC
jgi:hypothetical protein